MVISPNMHVCICFLHRFLIRFQPWWWLCNPEGMLPQYMIWLSSGSVFWSDFNRDGDYVIWRVSIYDMVIIWLRFLIQFQPWWWLCNPESMLPQYMIWLSFGSFFWFDFNCDGDYVIQRLFCWIIWYGYYLAPLFNVISTMMVIM